MGKMRHTEGGLLVCMGVLCTVNSQIQIKNTNKKGPEIVIRAPVPPVCETVTGKSCQSPFKYRGKTYNECTYDRTTNGKPWCAYETRRNGDALAGKWEDCDTSVCTVRDACTTSSGPDAGNTCMFPFTHNGVTYNSCARWTWQGTNYGKYGCSNCGGVGKKNAKPAFDIRGGFGASSSKESGS